MLPEKATSGTVVIVDDDAGIRQSLAHLMGAAGLTTLCLDCGEELFERNPPEGPACLVLDLKMPGASGIEVQNHLNSRGYDMPVIFLTGHAELNAAISAFKSGAADFFVKSEFKASELLDCVRDCLHRHADALARRDERLHIRQQLGLLTQRELQVACLAAGGLTNRVIGIELAISERTVEVHRGRAMRKLELHCLAELARLHEQLLDFSSKH